MPFGLPPKRDIQHHIDVIPGSIVPNKPAYRMNPKDTSVIQKQGEELMAKGLVRESLRILKPLHHSDTPSAKERWEYAYVRRSPSY